MKRSTCLVLIAILLSQTGCSSLFNPDRTITTALASYFPESESATREMEQQFESAVEDATRSLSDEEQQEEKQNARLPNGHRNNSSAQSRQLTHQQQHELNHPNTNANRITDSSWEKIERELAREQELQNQVQTRHLSGDFDNPKMRVSMKSDTQSSHSQSPTPQAESKQQVAQEQNKLIEIYDQINEQEIPRNYQPLPPLIQRPTIYHHSIVQPPLDSLQGSKSIPPGSEISWKDSLEATIAHLKEELKSLTPQSTEAVKLQKSLNVLNSVDSDKEFVDLVNKLTALRTSLPQHQYDAIREIIETTDNTKSNLIDQLKSAVSQVAKSAELKIQNATFCTAVEGFGKFERFPTNRFQAGDEVLLYCELENFEEEKRTSEKQSATNQCHLDAQIEFLDANDETVYIESFTNITDESESDRDDFYLFFRFRIPKVLSAGSHKVQIRFHDKIGRKNATLERPLSFTVIQKQP